jgi:hypothetical protein
VTANLFRIGDTPMSKTKADERNWLMGNALSLIFKK